MKTNAVELINIHEMDWKKAKEILGENIVLFPITDNIPEKNNMSNNLVINYSENKGVLFDLYSQFYQAINLLMTIPELIPQLFKTKEINVEECYELYIYTNGEYKTLIKLIAKAIVQNS